MAAAGSCLWTIPKGILYIMYLFYTSISLWSNQGCSTVNIAVSLLWKLPDWTHLAACLCTSLVKFIIMC